MAHRAGYAGLVGRPNVGKSTLLNRLLGQKLAITSHKPQTTRHRILGIRTLAEAQVVYVDTPGLHQRGAKAMNQYLNRTARAAIADVDVVVFVVAAGAWTDEDAAVLANLRRNGRPVVVAVNKVDEVRPRDDLLPFLAELGERDGFAAIVPLSARTGENCDALEREVSRLLPEGPPMFPEDQVTDRPERFFVAELLREQITRRYHKELPYAVAVEIERFEERPGGVSIGAVIWVERDSQRAILIGRQGSALKATATAARKQMAALLERPVHLEVWIKVKKSWSSDEKSLLQLGYGD
ncbi:MAG: GTPase Era [Gammaproteobacteria bacterium]|jgi:GTP-binding protein Era